MEVHDNVSSDHILFTLLSIDLFEGMLFFVESQRIREVKASITSPIPNGLPDSIVRIGENY
jgi:hypothetical protein